jgi:hypothetical protein
MVFSNVLLFFIIWSGRSIVKTSLEVSVSCVREIVERDEFMSSWTERSTVLSRDNKFWKTTMR